MVQAIGVNGQQQPASSMEPVDIHMLQFGETIESLAARFGITDPDALAHFRELNPELASGRALPGAIITIPRSSHTDRTTQMAGNATTGSQSGLQTDWSNGYGRRIGLQNRYNAEIESATSARPDVDPLILKSILAQESGFDRAASNRFGYGGIAQLGLAEAHETGLDTGASRRGNSRSGRVPYFDVDNDERFNTDKAIPAAAALLRMKSASLDSGINSGRTRLHGFDYYGQPPGDDHWRFVAAAYNGGERTILLALNHAYQGRIPDSVRWADVVGAAGSAQSNSPLWRAIREVGMNPSTKYAEISEYGENVVRRARQ